jgi:hypothetical protein
MAPIRPSRGQYNYSEETLTGQIPCSHCRKKYENTKTDAASDRTDSVSQRHEVGCKHLEYIYLTEQTVFLTWRK